MYARMIRCASSALIAAVLVVAPSPALASGSGDAWTDGGSVGAKASDSSAQSGTDGGGSGNGCTYTALSPREVAIAEDMAVHGIGPVPGDGPGTWYRRICPDGSGVLVWAPQA